MTEMHIPSKDPSRHVCLLSFSGFRYKEKHKVVINIREFAGPAVVSNAVQMKFYSCRLRDAMANLNIAKPR